jgi:hypothetical protein
MAYFLSAVQWVDAVTPPLEAHLQSLAASIKAQLPPENRAESRPPLPPAREVPPAQPRVNDRSPGNARRIVLPISIILILLLAAAGLYGSGVLDRPKPPDVAPTPATPATPPAEAAATTPVTPSRGNWPDAQLSGTNFDVFSCDTGNKASNDAVAGKVKDLLEKNRSSGRVRIRAWAASANQQPGYNVKGYQIRYENANNEKDLAMLIKPVVDGLVSPNAFALYPVQNKTPSYISLFVCPP